MPSVSNIILKYIGVSVLACCALLLTAQTPVSREYQIKAAFIFNFSQFVSWPGDAFPSRETPLVIGVLGRNPFGSYLEETVSGENVSGHPVVVQHYSSTEEIGNCHILFIGYPDLKKAGQAIVALKDRSILTVSDLPGFLSRGGMIRLFTKNNNIRFEINPEPAKAAGLSLSAKLLQLATIYNASGKN
jgi:hypothetical protein